ncbi:MAG TPA: ATP-binding protein, partial [Thermodesulfobacteriota bacterium]|nr:ATP-binding protein [Thermodesulfobacteriota bacterium]
YFMPHGHCYLWQTDILWLSVLSDGFIALAYFAIPLTLLYFVMRKKSVPFIGVFILFAAFILSCGATHVMDIWTVWSPLYRLDGLVKLVTAVLSIGTALVLFPVIPQALSLRSPKELEDANRALKMENAERRKAEEELRKARNELEERVLARTSELAQANERLKAEIRERELAERRKEELLREIESVNSELTDFAHIVSHDLKAPLQGIGTLTDWLADDFSDKLGEKGLETLDLLKGRVRSMNALIEGILSYTKAGREQESLERVDIRVLLDEVVHTVNLPENIEIELVSGVETIYCDRTRLEQVFQNLLTNSIKYIDKERGKIIINCVKEYGHYKFSFSDNGIGIGEKYFEKIFQIFRTLAPRDTKQTTGVGLAIVKKIIESYGGKIWLESEVGSGTTFYFMLPDRAPDSI